MSNIEWTDATWNPTVGCMKVSAGCEHCYAITTAYRLEHAFKQPQYAGLTRRLPDGSLNWTGKVRTLPDRLALPLSWKTPRRIFVDSMSDLFHDDVPDEFIDQVFAVMGWAEQHTFQVLTKRPERMREYLSDPERLLAIENAMCERCVDQDGRLCGYGNDDCQLTARLTLLPNVWLGVSVEDQRAADERIPWLLQTPAALRFLSCEPLLGPIELSDVSGWRDAARWLGRMNLGPDAISWVIGGGESGPKHRPMDLDWARSLRDQCQAAGVAFHFKQIGGATHAAGGRMLDGRTWDEFPTVRELAHA
jgi:protein gp37